VEAMLRIALIVIALVALPAPALAAEEFEGFVGINENGQLVRFSTQSIFALSVPTPIRGLLPGERIVALGVAQRGLVGVGSSARLYQINRRSGRASAIGPPFPQGLRGTRFSLAASPTTSQGRLVSDVGQDLAIDLRTGAPADGPGLRRADNGAVIQPAVDLATDGTLVGAQLAPLTLFRETAPNAATMTPIPVEERQFDPKVGEPIGFQIGSDGRGYILAVLSDRQRLRQSLIVMVDLATGEQLPKRRTTSYTTLPSRLTTFASIGRVRADRTPPIVRASLARHVSVRGLFRHRVPLRVLCTESCQVTARAESGGRRIGSALGFTSMPGFMRIDFFVSNRERDHLRASVGRRIRFVINVGDRKGNDRRLDRTARLVR
jgi:hypothetical protein